MSKATLFCIAAAALVSLVTADAIALDFRKEIRRDASDAHLLPRQKWVEADVSNEEILYLIDVTIGTPPQGFALQLDTGSSDIWIPADTSDVCLGKPRACSFGAFNVSDSRTYKLLWRNLFKIRYQDNSQIIGDFFSDTLEFGNTSIKNMQMGLGRRATRGLGIMGIGFQSGESVASQDLIYPNIINQLKDQKYINTLAYSLWLNDLDSSTGSILFGGVDTEKYEGDLSVLPVQVDAESGNITSFTVALSGVSFVNKAGKSQYSKNNIAVPVILDSGATLTYLPDDIAGAIASGVGAVADPDWGYVVPCSVKTLEATLSFSFGGPGGPTIKVDISEFVISLVIEGAIPPTFPDKTTACKWGLRPAGDAPILFGDTFLRSAYVVYNLENNQIGIAQTTFNATKDNIVEFSGKDIPGASTTVTGLKVTQMYSGHPLQTQAQPTGGTGQLSTGNSMPTFDLGKSGAARGTPRAGSIEMSTLLTGGVVLLSFIFGGSIVFFI